MTDKLDVRADHLRLVQEILATCARPDISVWAFGSRARGQANRSSDLDLAIDAGRPLTLSETALLAEAFDEAPLPYRVDIVDMRSITPEFKALIERDMTPLTEATRLA